MTGPGNVAVTLKPCPFCGAAGETQEAAGGGPAWLAYCSRDACCGSIIVYSEDRADAIAAWNTRAHTDLLAAAREALADIIPPRLIGESHEPYPEGKTTILMDWAWLKTARTTLASIDAALGTQDTQEGEGA